MQQLRQARFKYFFVAVWCTLILNMSFYLVEVKALKNCSKAMMENAKKLLSTVAEEEDAAGSSGAKSKTSQESDFLFQSRSHGIPAVETYGRKLRSFGACIEGLHGGFFETFSPPPEA